MPAYISGLTLIAEICHRKHGNAVSIATDVRIKLIECCIQDGTETITVDVGYCTITSLYKPPGTFFQFSPPENFNNQDVKVVISDFNGHNMSQGYNAINTYGQAVEE